MQLKVNIDSFDIEWITYKSIVVRAFSIGIFIKNYTKISHKLPSHENPVVSSECWNLCGGWKWKESKESHDNEKVGEGWKKVKRVHGYLSNKTLLICIKFHLYFRPQELRRHY